MAELPINYTCYCGEPFDFTFEFGYNAACPYRHAFLVLDVEDNITAFKVHMDEYKIETYAHISGTAFSVRKEMTTGFPNYFCILYLNETIKLPVQNGKIHPKPLFDKIKNLMIFS